MTLQSERDLLKRIEELEDRLAESDQLIESIKSGEVDAFAFNKNNRSEVYTLHSGDYAYRVLIENFGEGALNLSEDGLIVYTNNYFHDLLKKPYERIIGHSVFDFIHTDSQKKFTNLFEKALKNKSKGEINLFDGKTIIPVYISLTSLQPTLPSVGMIVTDLTEKRKHEKELEEKNSFIETIIESSNELIAVYGTDFTLLSINRATEEFLGLKKEEVIGRKFHELFPQLKGSRSENDLIRAFGGEFVKNEAYQSKYNQRYIQNYLTPLRDEQGTIYAALTIGNDVTDIKRAEEDLKKANQLLEQKNQQLAQSNIELASFSFIASHDLQEPLRKIQTFSNRILDHAGSEFSPQMKDYFARILSASGRMKNLISDLLNYSRTNTGDRVFELTDLNQVALEARNNLEERIEETQAVINIDSLPTIKGIPHQLNQLFTNIFSNSIKYRRPETTPVIHVSASLVNGNELAHPAVVTSNYYHKISISDNGIGFEQMYAEKIFELFQRLHGANKFEGTGIGLAICKKILQNHNGFIEATGKSGVGSVFTFYLPVHSA